MSTVFRSGRYTSIDAPKGASGSGGKRPRRGNSGRRPPRDKPVIGKTRQEEACVLCKRTDHKTVNCPYGHDIINLIQAIAASEAPDRPRDGPSAPAPQRRRRQEGPNARDRRRAARQARREEQQQAPEREEPREDIEEETREPMQREQEQTGGLNPVTGQDLDEDGCSQRETRDSDGTETTCPQPRLPSPQH